MAPSRKVYDFPLEKTSRTLVGTLKKRRNESTIADLVASTGLPKFQVEESLKHVLTEYNGHMKVTESGEILYYFPDGMRSTVKGFIPTIRNTLRKVLKVTGKVLSFLFKVWIMVMLVGYFVLFILLLLLAIFASLAASMSSRENNRSRSRGGGFLPFYLTTRVIELFIQVWLYSGIRKKNARSGANVPKRPLHKSVFGFVFGGGDPNAGWDATEKRAVIQYIRSHKGTISMNEFMALTGKRPQEAELLMNRYMLEYEGEPEVTEGGTIVYRFPELMRTRETAAALSIHQSPLKDLIPFSGNPHGTNRWIGILNSVNIVFGSFFVYYGTYSGPLSRASILDQFYFFVRQFFGTFTDNPVSVILFGLGAVPLVFSVLFYAIPAIRRLIERKRNEEIKKENFRKKVYTSILQNPRSINPENIKPAGVTDTPRGAVQFRNKTVKEFGAYKGVEVEEAGNGAFLYSYPEIEREQADLAMYRKKIDVSRYSLGDTVFDSGE